MLLFKCPKFIVVVSEGERERFKSKEGEGNEVVRRDSISVTFPSDFHPLGVKPHET